MNCGEGSTREAAARRDGRRHRGLRLRPRQRLSSGAPSAGARALPAPDRPRLPAGFRLGWTLFVLVWAPVYFQWYGPQNFLWFCDLANFLIALGLWLESPLLLSSQAAMVLVFQAAWAVDWVGRLAFGFHPLGGTEYMLDAALPWWLRALSLFHLAVPVVLIAVLRRVGYDRRAFRLATAIAWVVLPISFFVLDPSLDVNWLRRPFGVEQTLVPPPVYFVFALFAYPLVIFLPTHLLLRRTLPAAP